jgi:hypothetical protein
MFPWNAANLRAVAALLAIEHDHLLKNGPMVARGVVHER